MAEERDPAEPCCRGASGVGVVLLLSTLLAFAFLFEGLFLDRSLLGIDNRLIPPFSVAKDEAEVVAVNLATSDINGFILPETFAQRRALGEGRIPLWNPWQNLGQPLLADMGDAPFYPTALLALFLDPMRAYAWSMALHLVALSLGVHLLLRRHGVGAAASTFGAITIAFSGYVGVHLHLPHFVRVLAWFPWWLLAVRKLESSPGPRPVAWAALVVAAQFLAAFPQLAVWGLVGGGLYFVALRIRSGRPFDRRPVLRLGAAVVLGGFVASIHLAPTQEALGASLRPGRLDAASAARASLDAPALAGALAPRSLSWPVQELRALEEADRVQDWPPQKRWLSDDDQDNAVENTFWVGTLPLGLALLALCRRPRGAALLAALAVALSLAVALGVPGVSALVRNLPGLGVGAPKRVLVWTSFGLALLAAFGLDRLLRERRPGPLFVLGGLGLALFAGSFLPDFASWFPETKASQLADFEAMWHRDRLGWGVAGAGALLAALFLRRAPLLAAGLLTAVTATELVPFGRDFNPSQTRADQYRATPAIDWLLADGSLGEYRVLAFQGDFLLGGNYGQVFGFPMANGVSALLDRRVGELLLALDPGMVDPLNPRFTRGLNRELSLRSPLLDLLGVRDLVVSVAGNTFLETYGAQLGVERVYASEAEKIAFWRRPSALPRAFLVRNFESLTDPAHRLARLAQDDFDPRKVVVLEDVIEAVPGPRDEDEFPAVRFERPTPERIVLHTAAGRGAYLVLTEAYSTGWDATVDGEPVPVQRADHAFQAVWVPEGEHEVVFEYRSRGFELGRIAAIAGLLVILGLFAKSLVSGRAASPPVVA